VYRPDIIPNIKETTEHWRKLAIEAGFEGLYLVGCQTFGINDVREHGFDAAVEFPPHAIGSPDISAELGSTNKCFEGHIYDYRRAAKSKIDEGVTNYRKHYTCMLSWDNTARKGPKSHIFARFSLAQYQDWLSSNISKTLRQAHYSDDYPLYTFINAWNEWAEGTHLEPDRKYGYGYLQSTYDILSQHTTEKKDLDFLLGQPDPRDNKAIQKENCVIIHCHYLETLPTIVNRLKRLHGNFDIYVSTTNLKLAAQVKEDYPEFIVEVTPNIGRDIGPFIHTLRSIEAAGLEYNACLKVHTKKSVYRNDGSQLREKLLDQLFTPTTIELALSTLKHNSKCGDVGLICPKDFLVEHADANGYRLKYHMKSIEEIESATGILFNQSVFPAGSMFWFSQKALRRLLHIPMSWFDPEVGLADGTFAHTIERVFATIVQFDGYRVIPVND
jgi:lipopolysaccharide biosynthesis protein